MPPPTRDVVHRHFSAAGENNSYSKCNLCGNMLKGRHASNLKNHLAVKHVEMYNEVTNLNKERSKEKNCQTENTSKADEVIETIKTLCLELTAVCGRPLALLNDDPFKKLLVLASAKNPRSKEINEKSIKSMIPNTAYEIKLKIASEVRNKLICLKVDSATCMDRSFLGINIQYIKKNKIIVRNLSVSEVYQRQTGEFLKEKVIEVLEEFMITKDQIYSMTTDNGANMKKMTRLLGGEYFTEDSIIDDDDYHDIINFNDDDIMNVSDDDIMNIDNNNIDIENIFNNNIESNFQVRGMLCAAHSLQLAIKDAIQENIEVQATLGVARRITKILRTPTNQNLIKLAKLKLPVIECSTRWTSTFKMIERLVSLKDFCASLASVSELVSEEFWQEINNLISCMKPLNKCTLILQREQLTIGDFFIEWMKCKTKLESIGYHFASSLTKSMSFREKDLLEMDVILESIYLDGRLNVILSDDQCTKAKYLINQTWKQIQKCKGSAEESISSTISNTAADSDNPGSSNQIEEADDDLYLLENILTTTERLRGLTQNTTTSLNHCLNELRSSPRLSLTTNILLHWSNKLSINNYSEIAEVANVILASPATQVSVERMFSSLNFILSPLRSNLSPNLLKNMLFIRSNQDLL